tara:strand:+ start:1549 stop:1680 length:132 start_codon:yes stop_codon:yes gene_type:complete
MPFKSKKQRDYLKRNKPDVWLKLKLGSISQKMKANPKKYKKGK